MKLFKLNNYVKIIICFMAFSSISCNKDSIDDMFLTDGMVVFRLGDKDWILKNMTASFSDLSNIGGGQIITIYGTVNAGIETYKTVEINIKDIETISVSAYSFIGNEFTGSSINIDAGKTPSTGSRYKTTNPDDSTTGSGKVNLTDFNKISNKISGSFSGEIFKSNYTDSTGTAWEKTTIKSGRFNNIPVIGGK